MYGNIVFGNNKRKINAEKTTTHKARISPQHTAPAYGCPSAFSQQYAATIDMIRQFTQFYKQNLKKLNLDAYLLAYTSDLSASSSSCPGCGAGRSLSPHASYNRGVAVYDGGMRYRRFAVARYLCKCGHTHAALPEIIVPYGRYGILFMLVVLKAYFFRNLTGETVAEIAPRHEISVSTLYRWKAKFSEHASLWLGALADIVAAVSEFMPLPDKPPNEASDTLARFFGRFGFSLMQTRRDTS